MSLATSDAFTNVTGTGWTVNVTPCNLDTDLTVKDFIVIATLAGVPTQLNNTDFVKQSAVQLQYTGSALPASTPIRVSRRTPKDPRVTVDYRTLLSSTDYNKELERISRRAYEYELNGVGPLSTINLPTVLDTPYGPVWNGDVINAPSRNAVHDKFVLVDGTTTNHNNRLNTLEGQNLNNRLNTVESVNATQNTRLDGVESVNSTQNGRLDTLESFNAGSRLTNLESKNGIVRVSWNGLTYNNNAVSSEAPSNNPTPSIFAANIPGWSTVTTGPASITVPTGHANWYLINLDSGYGSYTGSNNPGVIAYEINVGGVNNGRFRDVTSGILFGRITHTVVSYIPDNTVFQVRVISTSNGGTHTINVLTVTLRKLQ